MEQYYMCIVLIVFLFLLFIHELIRDYKLIKYSYRRIALCLILALLFKYNYGIYFYGLEYEDAYVFSFCARQFHYNIFPTSFLVDAVSVGSLKDPLFTSTYGGHFIMYPTYLSLYTNILGYSPAVLSIANTVLAFFILMILSILSGNQKCWFVPPVLYCCAPVINLFATCFLSEIFSSFVCLVFMYTYFRKKSIYNCILCFVSFIVAIMSKRENFVLLLLPTIEVIHYVRQMKIYSIKNYIVMLIKYGPFLIIVCGYFLFVQNVFDIEKVESMDIENYTFSIQYMIVLLPVFIKSLLTFDAFSVVFAVSIIWFVYILVVKKRLLLIVIYPFMLFGLYLLLYSLHYRGYFFVKEKSISPFETYRYINNFFYLLAVMFAFFRYRYIRVIKLLVCVLLMFSLYKTFLIRTEMSETEYRERFNEAQIISEYIRMNSSNSVLICENVLLYQNICDDAFRICDIRLYDKLDRFGRVDCYLLLSDMKYLRERYSLTIDLRNAYPMLNLGSEKYLYKIETDIKSFNNNCSFSSKCYKL